MAKVLTFSRVFPSYHPKAGQPTYFMEKIWRSLPIPCSFPNVDQSVLDILEFDKEPHVVKHHTIRAGHRWKAGDWFSPRVWSGKPYNSKQIQFAPDIQVKKVWDFEVNRGSAIGDDDIIFFVNNYIPSVPLYNEVAKNDGLTLDDLYGWFNKPFDGQIICWNDQIKY